MSEKKIFPEPLEALIVVLVTFSLLFLLIFVYGKLSGAEDAVEMMNNARAIYIFGGLLFVIFPGVYARVKGYSLQRVFRLNPVPSGMILWSLVVGLSLAVVGDELDRIVQIVIPSPEWLNEMLLPLKAKSTLDWVKVILGAVLIAAFSEEFLFRGFLQKSLEIKGDVTRAVLLTSITWALIHQNPYWAIQILLWALLSVLWPGEPIPFILR